MWAWRIGRNSVAADHMIVAYSRGDGAATSYEIAWMTVTLRHLRADDDSWARIDPVHRWLQTLWSGGHSPGTLRRPRPCSRWRAGNPVMAQCMLGRPAMGSNSTVLRSGRQAPPLPDTDLPQAAGSNFLSNSPLEPGGTAS